MTDATISAMTGTVALPRQNGELLFDEPWESRAFGIAVALSETGTYAWDSFRTHLIGEIEGWEIENGSDSSAPGPDGEAWNYYRRWLASLEHVLVEGGVISTDELASRQLELAAHDDHDHGHDDEPEHDHDHGDSHDQIHHKTEVTT